MKYNNNINNNNKNLYNSIYENQWETDTYLELSSMLVKRKQKIENDYCLNSKYTNFPMYAVNNNI